MPAKVGIGIGAGAGASALIALVVVMFVRRRHQSPVPSAASSLKISDPMPGSGRSFANDHHNAQYEGEMEFKSSRYEDLLPRTTPHYMV